MHNDHPMSREPQDQALDWFLRHQSEAADSPAFIAWRDSDPAHAAAYARAQAVWAAPALAEALADARPRWRAASMMRMAASLALFALIGSGALRLAGVPLRLPASHGAAIGGQDMARLDDGTRMVLDSGAAVDVRYTSAERRLAIRDGRAFFDVGKDPRPFRVEAGDILVRDIGTRFWVEREGDAVHVAVEHGEVALRPANATAAANAAAEQHLIAGQTGGYAQGFLPVRSVPTDISFGWMDHRLFFAQTPVGDVVQALRRYHRGWIVLANPRLAQVKVSGGYDTRDPAAAMEDLARLSGGTLIRLSDRLLILR